MPRLEVTVHMLDVERVQRLMLAALDLLVEVENSDPALTTAAATEAAHRFRDVIEEGIA